MGVVSGCKRCGFIAVVLFCLGSVSTRVSNGPATREGSVTS